MNPITLDQAFEKILANLPADAPAETRQLVRADLQLQFDFPGCYVAYADSWETIAGEGRLTRKVIAHSPSVAEVQEACAGCTDPAAVVLDYVGDPAAAPEPLLP
jgi:hypothetical protein